MNQKKSKRKSKGRKKTGAGNEKKSQRGKSNASRTSKGSSRGNSKSPAKREKLTWRKPTASVTSIPKRKSRKSKVSKKSKKSSSPKRPTSRSSSRSSSNSSDRGKSSSSNKSVRKKPSTTSTLARKSKLESIVSRREPSSDVYSRKSSYQSRGVPDSSSFSSQAPVSLKKPSVIISATEDSQIIEILGSRPCECPDERKSFQLQPNSQSQPSACATLVCKPQPSCLVQNSCASAAPIIRTCSGTQTTDQIPSHISEQFEPNVYSKSTSTTNSRPASQFTIQPTNQRVQFNPDQSLLSNNSVIQNPNQVRPYEYPQNFQSYAGPREMPAVLGPTCPDPSGCQEPPPGMRNPSLYSSKVYTAITLTEQPPNSLNLYPSLKYPVLAKRSRTKLIDAATGMDKKQKKSKNNSKRNSEKKSRKSGKRKISSRRHRDNKHSKRKSISTQSGSVSTISDMFSGNSTDTTTTAPTSAPSSAFPSTTVSSSGVSLAPCLRLKPIPQHSMWKAPPIPTPRSWPTPNYFPPRVTNPPMPWRPNNPPQINGNRFYSQPPHRSSDWNSPQMQDNKEPVFNPPEVIWMLSPHSLHDPRRLLQGKNPMTPRIYVYPSRRSQSYPQANECYHPLPDYGSVSTGHLNCYPPETNMYEYCHSDVYRAASCPQMSTSPDRPQRAKGCKHKVKFAPFMTECVPQLNSTNRVSSWPCVPCADDYKIYDCEEYPCSQEVTNEPYQGNISRDVDTLSQGNDSYGINESEISAINIDPEYEIKCIERQSNIVHNGTPDRYQSEFLTSTYNPEHDNEYRVNDYYLYNNIRAYPNDTRLSTWDIPNIVYPPPSYAYDQRTVAQASTQTQERSNAIVPPINNPYASPGRFTNLIPDIRKPSIKRTPMEYPGPQYSNQGHITNPINDRGIYHKPGGMQPKEDTPSVVHINVDMRSRQTPTLPRSMGSQGPPNMSGRRQGEESYLPQSFKRQSVLPWTIHRNPQIMIALGVPKFKSNANKLKSTQGDIINGNIKPDRPELSTSSQTSNNIKEAISQQHSSLINHGRSPENYTNKRFTPSSNSNYSQKLNDLKNYLLHFKTDANRAFVKKIPQKVSREFHNQNTDTKKEKNWYLAPKYVQPSSNSLNPTTMYQLPDKPDVPFVESCQTGSENSPGTVPQRVRTEATVVYPNFYNYESCRQHQGQIWTNTFTSTASQSEYSQEVLHSNDFSEETQGRSVSTMVSDNSFEPRYVDASTMPDCSISSLYECKKSRTRSRAPTNWNSNTRQTMQCSKGLEENCSRSSTFSQDMCSKCRSYPLHKRKCKKRQTYFETSVKKREKYSTNEGRCVNAKYYPTSRIQHSGCQTQFDDDEQFLPYQAKVINESSFPPGKWGMITPRRNTSYEIVPQQDLSQHYTNYYPYQSSMWSPFPYRVQRTDAPGADYQQISKEYPSKSQEDNFAFARETEQVPNPIKKLFPPYIIPTNNKMNQTSNAADAGIYREPIEVPNVSHQPPKRRQYEHVESGSYIPDHSGGSHVPGERQRSAGNAALEIHRYPVGLLDSNVPQALNAPYQIIPPYSLQSSHVPQLPVDSDHQQKTVDKMCEMYAPSSYNSSTKGCLPVTDGKHAYIDHSSHMIDEVKRTFTQFSESLQVPDREAPIEESTNQGPLFRGTTRTPYGFCAIRIPHIAKESHYFPTSIPVANENVIHGNSRIASKPHTKNDITMNRVHPHLIPFAQQISPTNYNQAASRWIHTPNNLASNMPPTSRNVNGANIFTNNILTAAKKTRVPLIEGQYPSASKMSELLFLDDRSCAEASGKKVEENHLSYKLLSEYQLPEQNGNPAGLENGFHASSTGHNPDLTQTGTQSQDTTNESSLRKEQIRYQHLQNTLHSLLEPVLNTSDLAEYGERHEWPYDMHSISSELSWDQFVSPSKIRRIDNNPTKLSEEKGTQIREKRSQIYEENHCLSELRHSEDSSLSPTPWLSNAFQSENNQNKFITQGHLALLTHQHSLLRDWSMQGQSSENPGSESGVKWHTASEGMIGAFAGMPSNRPQFKDSPSNSNEQSIPIKVDGDTKKYTSKPKVSPLEVLAEICPCAPNFSKNSENAGVSDNNTASHVSPIIPNQPPVRCCKYALEKLKDVENNNTNSDTLAPSQNHTSTNTTDQNSREKSNSQSTKTVCRFPCPWSQSDLPDASIADVNDPLPSCVFTCISQTLPCIVPVTGALKYVTMLATEPLDIEPSSNEPPPTPHVQHESSRPIVAQRPLREYVHRSATEILQGSILEGNMPLQTSTDRFCRGSVRSRSLSRSRAGLKRSPTPRKVCSENLLRS